MSGPGCVQLSSHVCVLGVSHTKREQKTRWMVGLRNKHAAEETKALREDGAAAQTTNTPKSISRMQPLYLPYWMCLGEPRV